MKKFNKPGTVVFLFLAVGVAALGAGFWMLNQTPDAAWLPSLFVVGGVLVGGGVTFYSNLHIASVQQEHQQTLQESEHHHQAELNRLQLESQAEIELSQRKHELSMAALERRLEIAQIAYARASVFGTVYDLLDRTKYNSQQQFSQCLPTKQLEAQKLLDDEKQWLEENLLLLTPAIVTTYLDCIYNCQFVIENMHSHYPRQRDGFSRDELKREVTRLDFAGYRLKQSIRTAFYLPDVLPSE